MPGMCPTTRFIKTRLPLDIAAAALAATAATAVQVGSALMATMISVIFRWY